jgi:hypothetical protein
MLLRPALKALSVIAAAGALAACSANTAETPSSTLALDVTPSSTTIIDSPLCDRLPELTGEKKRAVLENDPEYLHEAVARLAGSISSCYLRYENDPLRAEIALVRYATDEQAAAARDALVADWEMQIESHPAVISTDAPELSSKDGTVTKRLGSSAAVVSANGGYFVLGYSATASYVEQLLGELLPYVSTN